MEETAFKSAYKRLNKAQKEAVDTIEGPVMVIAGPGTGKTTILTLRIANILQKTDIGPENVLALTFTNSGVHAMRKKLLSIIGDTAYRVSISTFHSFAEHIIKEFPSYFPSLEYARVITDLEKVHLLEDIIKAGKFKHIVSSYDPLSSLRSVKSAIESIKQDGLSPEEFEARIPKWKEDMLADEKVYYKRKTGKFKEGDAKPAELEKIENRINKAKEIAQVFETYQEELKKQNRYDFSDMVLSVLHELEANKNLKLDVQEHYQYIHVDEHQDTNDGQNKLVELLTDASHLEGRPNVFTVGDEKQSIYRFQGASQETFTRFNEIFNDVKVIALTDNYRSTTSVLEGSQSLITHTLSEATPLVSSAQEDAPIEVLEFRNYKFELLYVAREIQELIKSGVSPSEIAIIYRKNKHIEEIKQLFSAEGIPYSIRSKDNVLDDACVANLITLCKVIDNPHNNNILGQSLFIDFLKLDPLVSIDSLALFRKESKTGDHTLLKLLEKNDSYKNYISLIKDLKSRSLNTSFAAFFKEVLQESGYLEHVLSLPDGRDHLRKIYTLFDEVKRQSDQNKSYGLSDFIAFVDAMHAYSLEIESAEGMADDGVQCMTAHKSKGLEFTHVFMVNTTRSNWEKNRGAPALALPIDNFKGEIDDERRLFYVSMTRAKKHLSISSSVYDWEGKEREPSQFIAEINEAHMRCMQTEGIEEKLDDHLSQFLEKVAPKRDIFEPTYLHKRFLEQNLSVSALNNYLSCPIKYFFRNLILIPDVYTPFLIYGNTVHVALELFFDDCKAKKSILPKDSLITHFVEALQKVNLFGDDYERYKERGENSLGMYYDANHETWGTDLETELYIKRQHEIKGGKKITLSGMIDKVEYLEGEGGGRVRVIDYKTGKAYSEKSTKAQKADLQRQVIFYHMLLETYKDGAYTVAEAVLDFVEKTKKGEFEQKSFDVSDDDKKGVKEEIESLADDVESGALLQKGCDKKDCEWCALYRRLQV